MISFFLSQKTSNVSMFLFLRLFNRSEYGVMNKNLNIYYTSIKTKPHERNIQINRFVDGHLHNLLWNTKIKCFSRVSSLCYGQDNQIGHQQVDRAHTICLCNMISNFEYI